jgi:hypothetical protein
MMTEDAKGGLVEADYAAVSGTFGVLERPAEVKALLMRGRLRCQSHAG